MKKVTTNSLWGMFCVRSLMLMAILGFSLVGSDAYVREQVLKTTLSFSRTEALTVSTISSSILSMHSL